MDSLTALRGVQRSDSDSLPDGAVLARGLGWFSIGRGIAELAAPHLLARTFGIDPGGVTATAFRLHGVRELATGIAILLQPRRPLPVMARVVGDLLDVALLGLAAGTKRTSGTRLATTMVAAAGTTVLDVIASRRVARSYEDANQPVIFSVTINRPPAEVYAFWRKLEQLPQFMDYLESVQETGAKTSHWVAKLPIGGTVEWDAVITQDRPGELIAWESAEGSTFTTRGKVTFAKAPGRDMTEVRVEMQVGALGARPSALIAKLVTKPQVKGDLRRFKQIMETGEVLFSDASRHKGPHPAQPSLEGRRAEYTNPAPRSQVSSSTVPARASDPAIAASPTPPEAHQPRKGVVS
ncbi:MAG: SRPBCC family protein [Myxococcota bacterium]|nr:SRPBCC family protein [Myxococcota bacterium]